jgi:drug/metabolite transporter (DMT)-like permease
VNHLAGEGKPTTAKLRSVSRFIRMTSAATVATPVEPLTAALLAAFVLGERLPLPAAVGGLLILGAVGALRPREEHPAPL